MTDPSNRPAPPSGATVLAETTESPPGSGGIERLGEPNLGREDADPATNSGGDPAPAGHDALVGAIVSERYRILRKLGEGGMGSVYLAEHTTIAKKLALKVLSPEYSHKQELVDRFLQEARAASMIDQENVVEITDFGSTPTGSVFFVMEYLQGEDLSHTIHREGPLPWARVAPMMLQICEALAAAHAAGIIHRDMKPENCYRIRRGATADFIKVLDFGIAKLTSETGESGKGLTRTGMIFGTPEYMSPEQAKGEKVDRRVDIYATGVIMFELLTGRVPFTADTFMGILTKHMFEAPPAPRSVAPGADIPAEAESIILKALQKDRELRFQDMREMARAIAAVGTGAAAVDVVPEELHLPTTGRIAFNPNSTQIAFDESQSSTQPPRRRMGPGIVAGVAAVTVALGLGGWWWSQQRERDEPPRSATVDEVGSAPAAAEAKVPAKAATVEIIVETPGISAEVLDGRDFGRLGASNMPLTLPAGDDPVALVVRADGYQEVELEVVPSYDKTLTPELTLVVPEPEPASEPDVERAAEGEPSEVAPAEHRSEPRKRRRRKPRRRAKRSSPQSKPDAKPEPRRRKNAELRDPFG